MSWRDPVDGQARTVRIWLLDCFRVSVISRTIEEVAWRLRKAARSTRRSRLCGLIDHLVAVAEVSPERPLGHEQLLASVLHHDLVVGLEEALRGAPACALEEALR